MRKRKVSIIFIYLLIITVAMASVYYVQEFRYKEKIELSNTNHANEILLIQQEAKPEKTNIYVYSRDIDQGQILTENDMFMAQIDSAIAPENIIADKADVVGKVLKVYDDNSRLKPGDVRVFRKRYIYSTGLITTTMSSKENTANSDIIIDKFIKVDGKEIF
jgi:hypothetical protein